MSLFILPEEKTPTKFFSMSSLFNPNKAGIFEGSFSWGAQLDPLTKSFYQKSSSLVDNKRIECRNFCSNCTLKSSSLFSFFSSKIPDFSIDVLFSYSSRSSLVITEYVLYFNVSPLSSNI